MKKKKNSEDTERKGREGKRIREKEKLTLIKNTSTNIIFIDLITNWSTRKWWKIDFRTILKRNTHTWRKSFQTKSFNCKRCTRRTCKRNEIQERGQLFFSFKMMGKKEKKKKKTWKWGQKTVERQWEGREERKRKIEKWKGKWGNKEWLFFLPAAIEAIFSPFGMKTELFPMWSKQSSGMSEIIANQSINQSIKNKPSPSIKQGKILSI